MDNFSARSERNFHNLAAKPKRMHLLDKPSGYASAMVKNSLSYQMRFTVQVLEEELCAAGDPHVLQIKLLGEDLREPSSWKLFAHIPQSAVKSHNGPADRLQSVGGACR